MESVCFQDMCLKTNTTTRRSDPARRPVLLEDKAQRSGFVSSLKCIMQLHDALFIKSYPNKA